jgi:hypothetical protein
MSPARPLDSYSNLLHRFPGGGGSQTPDNGLAGFFSGQTGPQTGPDCAGGGFC